MTTPWYYDYYEPGTFPHQQELCRLVSWTCNLEGQKIVPTFLVSYESDGSEKKTPTQMLTGIPANPLTIRLRALGNALNQLENNIRPLDELISKHFEKQFNKHKMPGIGGNFVTQSNTLINTGGAPVEIIKIEGKRREVEWHYDITHIALYEYFMNLISILDRLATEINLLYDLRINKVDWAKFAAESKKDNYLIPLSKKDTCLAEFIRCSIPNFTQAVKYRNRLAHDGIIKIEADIGFQVNKYGGITVYLAQDPDSSDSLMTIDALEYCVKTKANVLKLLDGSYELIIRHIHECGNPPW